MLLLNELLVLVQCHAVQCLRLTGKVGIPDAQMRMRFRWQGSHAGFCCCCMVGVPIQVHSCSVHRLCATKGIRLLELGALLWLCLAGFAAAPTAGGMLRGGGGLHCAATAACTSPVV